MNCPQARNGTTTVRRSSLSAKYGAIADPFVTAKKIGSSPTAKATLIGQKKNMADTDRVMEVNQFCNEEKI